MDEYTDDQINEWTKDDLLNSPLLSDEEVEQLRKQKQELTQYGQEKLRKLMSQEEILKIATDFMEEHKGAFEELAKIERKELMTDVAQKLVDAGHRVSDAGVPLGKLIREGKEPMSARVRYEYAAVLRELVNQLQQGNFVRICDILDVADELEELK